MDQSDIPIKEMNPMNNGKSFEGKVVLKKVKVVREKQIEIRKQERIVHEN